MQIFVIFPLLSIYHKREKNIYSWRRAKEQPDSAETNILQL